MSLFDGLDHVDIAGEGPCVDVASVPWYQYAIRRDTQGVQNASFPQVFGKDRRYRKLHAFGILYDSSSVRSGVIILRRDL